MRIVAPLLLVFAAQVLVVGCTNSKCDCQGTACETCSGIPPGYEYPTDSGRADVEAATD